MMSLIELLNYLFPKGLNYKDAMNLQAALFCRADCLPVPCTTLLSRQNICDAFAMLAQAGMIHHYDIQLAKSMRGLLPDFSSSVGHTSSSLPDMAAMLLRWCQPGIAALTDSAHWQILLDAAYRLPEFYESDSVEQLLAAAYDQVNASK
jgi:hypothetical protein